MQDHVQLLGFVDDGAGVTEQITEVAFFDGHLAIVHDYF
jgi:hypothetical protein